MTLKLRKLLRSKHSPIDSNWKKNHLYIFFIGRDGNPSTRSARQIKCLELSPEQMSQIKTTITHH
jgi:hypothetical protein